MSYTKHNYTNGDILNATQLNEMDEQISLNETAIASKADTSSLDLKVDKVTGKGLSTNDYTTAAKNKVDAIPSNPKYTDTVYDDTEIVSALSNKVDKVTGKGLSTNDYTAAAKSKVDAIPSSPKYTDTVYDDTTITANLTAEIARATAAEDVLDGRISSIATLPPGSSSGDAELRDIRVKANSYEADSAGNAIREQINSLYNNINGVVSQLTYGGGCYNLDFPIKNMYINASNGALAAAEGWSVTPLIPVNGATVLTATSNMTGSGYNQYNAFYDESKTFIENFNLQDKINVPSNAAYLRCSKETSASVTLGAFARIKGIDNYSYLPAHYLENNYFQDKLSAIRSATNQIRNGISFVFATDLHFMNNSMSSQYVIKNILDNTTVPFAVLGGDYAYVDYSTKRSLTLDAQTLVDYKNYIGKDRCFAIRGNHDFYRNKPTEGYLTEKEIYNSTIRSSEIVAVDGIPNSMCYCFDIPMQNTRFIFLNSKEANGNTNSYVSGYQARWFANKLAEKPDYNFIVVAHIPNDNYLATFDQWGKKHNDAKNKDDWTVDWGYQEIIHKIMKNFNNRESESYTTTETSFSVNFTACTGKIVMCVSGHMHWDGENTTENVFSVLTASDARYDDDKDISGLPEYGSHNPSNPRLPDTVREMVCDVFAIDYDAKTIKAIRVGAGKDRDWTY